MRIRKRLTALAIGIAITLFVIGAFADIIVTRTSIPNTTKYSDISVRTSLESGLDLVVSVNVTLPDSVIRVTLNSTGNLLLDVNFNGESLYSANESQVNTNYLIYEPGLYHIVFTNNNTASVNFGYAILLTGFTTQKNEPYSWLLLPTFVGGEVALFLILPMSFYEEIKGKWKKKYRKNVIEILILIAIGLFFFSLNPLLKLTTGTTYSLNVPVSPSMVPTIKPGDLAIVASVSPQNLKVGDIIVFNQVVYNLSSPSTYKLATSFIHRIVAIKTANYQVYFQTKGDNNPSNDEWFVTENGVTGKVVFVIPYIGSVILLLNLIQVKIAVFVILACIVIIWPSKKKTNNGSADKSKVSESQKKGASLNSPRVPTVFN